MNTCNDCGKDIPDHMEIEAASRPIPREKCDECRASSDPSPSERYGRQKLRRRTLRAANFSERERALSEVGLRDETREFLTREFPREDFAMLICGPTEAGKTAQACAALRWWVDEKIDAGRRELSPLYINVAHLLHSWRPGGSDDASYSLDVLESADLLVLDDLGKSVASEWVSKKLYLIFDRRGATRKPTILTANASIDGLEKHEAYTPPVMRRLREMTGQGDWQLGLQRRWWQ